MRWPTVAMIGALHLGAAASAQAQLPIDPTLLVARHDSMVVRVRGVRLGWRTIQVAKTDAGFLAIDLLSLGEFAQTRTEISLDQYGRLKWVQQGGMLQGIAIRTTLEYRRTRVRGVAVVADTAGPRTVPSDTIIPSGTIDDNALSVYLPTLPWANGARWTFPTYLADAALLRPMTLSVLGSATVSISSGPVESWRVELQGGDSPLYFYVSQARPHRVVRIEVPAVGTEYLLEE